MKSKEKKRRELEGLMEMGVMVNDHATRSGGCS